jgi:hypothetical protein
VRLQEVSTLQKSGSFYFAATPFGEEPYSKLFSVRMESRRGGYDEAPFDFASSLGRGRFLTDAVL